MTVLNTVKRQAVLFDATNKEHRTMYANFLKTRTWGKTPVRFELEPEWTNLVSMIEHKLLQFYFKEEFQ